ncbi:MAG: hypothetical protein KGS10_04345 [Chloroflexi bacterium]|nr:hypothetical protein [Chloroflexota bacterium]
MNDLDRAADAAHRALDDYFDLPRSSPEWERETLREMARRAVDALVEAARAARRSIE